MKANCQNHPQFNTIWPWERFIPSVGINLRGEDSLDKDVTFLSSRSDAAILDRFGKNVEDVGLNK